MTRNRLTNADLMTADDFAAEDDCLAKLADILTQTPPGGRRCNNGPAEIVDHVYLGSMVDALDVRLLRRLRITHVLSCAPSAVRNYADSLHMSFDDLPDRRTHSATCRSLQGSPPVNGCKTPLRLSSSSALPVCRATSSYSTLGRNGYSGYGDVVNGNGYRPLANRLSMSSAVERHLSNDFEPKSHRDHERFFHSAEPNPYDSKKSGVHSYMEIDAMDVPDYPILALHYGTARQFLDAARSCGGRALVHCELGINRSAVLAVAYLVDSESLPLTQAVRRVRIDRPNVLRNEGFRRQLVRFAAERRLLGRMAPSC